MRPAHAGTTLAAWACALALAPAAGAAPVDRSDPIPASVGPGITHAFFVNPAPPEGAPPALAGRFLGLVRQDLARWGDTYLGTTTASPSDHRDGIDTIGFGTLPGDILGRTQGSEHAFATTVDTLPQCRPVAGAPTDDDVTRETATVALRLRRDVVRRGRVVRRTATARAHVPRIALSRSALQATTCRPASGSLVESGYGTETDITISTTPSVPWEPGPAYPDDGHVDLETVLLHEIGHAHGLAHQVSTCDPSTPMRADLPVASWWRGRDDTVFSDCSELAPPVDVPAPDPGPALGTPLSGTTIFASTQLPAWMDQARFDTVVAAVTRQLGGTFGGERAAAAGAGDDASVVGIGPFVGNDLYESWATPHSEITTIPEHTSCQPFAHAFTVTRARPRLVHARVHGRRVALRRDGTRQAPITLTDYTCRAVDEQTSTAQLPTEYDVLLDDATAYEPGPGHPVDGTRFDLQTVVLAGLLQVTGSPISGWQCDPATPVAPLMPGDWWRGTQDVSRAACLRQTDSARGPGTGSGLRAGRLTSRTTVR